MRVFIDANTYLGFIRLSDEKLESIKVFRKLLKKKSFSLIFPKVTQDEVFRNIPNVVSLYIRTLGGAKPPKPSLAVSIRDKNHAKKLRSLLKQWENEIEKLKEAYLSSVREFVKEDITDIKKLAESLTDAEERIELIMLAKTRNALGNPPGKGKNIGDEYAWEHLLKFCIDDDLMIVSNDIDWRDVSVTNKTKLHPFLLKEWKSKSKKKIRLFRTLGGLLNSIEAEKISKEEIEKEKEASREVGTLVSGLAVGSASVSPSATGGGLILRGSSSASVSPSSSLSPSASAPPPYSSCPSCGSHNIRRNELITYVGSFLCNDCGFLF